MENDKIDKTNISGIVDISPSMQGKCISGLEVFSPEKIANLKPELILSTVVTTPKMKEKITETLKNCEILCDVEINDDLFKCFDNFED